MNYEMFPARVAKFFGVSFTNRDPMAETDSDNTQSGRQEVARLLRAMKRSGEGSHESTLRGWITIDKDGAKWSAMWTSSRDSHYPHEGNGPAYSVSIDDSGLVSCCESAITMHLSYYRGHPSKSLSGRKAKAKASGFVRRLLYHLPEM